MSDLRLMTRLARRDDSGVALVVVMQFMLVASAISGLVAVASVHALRSATQDSAGSAAQATSDAGVAEAMNYLRGNSLLNLTCKEPLNPSTSTWKTAAGCTTAGGWADPLSPRVVSGGTVLAAGASCPSAQDCYQVWIGTLQPFKGASGALNGSSYTPEQPALLRIHSLGISGVGPGGRSVAVDVKVLPSRFPFGVFANSFQMRASHIPAQHESIFTTGDVNMKCPLTGLDYANNMPAAVHAAGKMIFQNGSCHGYPQSTVPANCTTSFPYDQDSQGGSLPAGNPCLNYTARDPNFTGITPTIPAYPQSTLFTASMLAQYGYRPGGLSPAEYDQLKAEAQAEGTYFDATLTPNLAMQIPALISSGVTNPVVYVDSTSTHALSPDEFPSTPNGGFFRTPGTDTTSCSPYAATIVVRGGASASISWSKTGSPGSFLVASIFLPDAKATLSMTGQAHILGTVYADSISFNGNADIQLDPCFVANPPGGVLDVTVTNYRVVDTTNVQ